jgi:hypothetical protein
MTDESPPANGWPRHELLVMTTLAELKDGLRRVEGKVDKVQLELAGMKVQVSLRATAVAAAVTILTVLAAAIARAL